MRGEHWSGPIRAHLEGDAEHGEHHVRERQGRDVQVGHRLHAPEYNNADVWRSGDLTFLTPSLSRIENVQKILFLLNRIDVDVGGILLLLSLSIYCLLF